MVEQVSRTLSSSLAASAVMPMESMLEVKKREKRLYIGIPKEISFQENRIPLVPDAVALLIANGHEIVIEAGAGKTSNFEDSDFSEAGGRIVYSTVEVYKADLIVKVAPPSKEELALMQPNQNLLSILQIRMQNEEYMRQLSSKR